MPNHNATQGVSKETRTLALFLICLLPFAFAEKTALLRSKQDITSTEFCTKYGCEVIYKSEHVKGEVFPTNIRYATLKPYRQNLEVIRKKTGEVIEVFLELPMDERQQRDFFQNKIPITQKLEDFSRLVIGLPFSSLKIYQPCIEVFRGLASTKPDYRYRAGFGGRILRMKTPTGSVRVWCFATPMLNEGYYLKLEAVNSLPGD